MKTKLIFIPTTLWVVEIYWKGQKWRPANILLNRTKHDALMAKDKLDSQINYTKNYKLRVKKYVRKN